MTPEYECEHVGCPNGCTTRTGLCVPCVRAAIRDAVEAEREACAAIVDADAFDVHYIAAAIRQRTPAHPTTEPPAA